MCRVRLFSRIRFAQLVLVLSAALSLTGCQTGTGTDTATVSGTVTSKGKKVTTGAVIFQGGAGQKVYATIGADGTYTVANVPVGAVLVAVGGMDDAMPSVTPAPGGKPTLAAGPRPPVPNKYWKIETSDLKYTVQSGTQKIDIQAD